MTEVKPITIFLTVMCRQNNVITLAKSFLVVYENYFSKDSSLGMSKLY